MDETEFSRRIAAGIRKTGKMMEHWDLRSILFLGRGRGRVDEFDWNRRRKYGDLCGIRLTWTGTGIFINSSWPLTKNHTPKSDFWILPLRWMIAEKQCVCVPLIQRAAASRGPPDIARRFVHNAPRGNPEHRYTWAMDFKVLNVTFQKLPWFSLLAGRIKHRLLENTWKYSISNSGISPFTIHSWTISTSMCTIIYGIFPWKPHYHSGFPASHEADDTGHQKNQNETSTLKPCPSNANANVFSGDPPWVIIWNRWSGMIRKPMTVGKDTAKRCRKSHRCTCFLHFAFSIFSGVATS